MTALVTGGGGFIGSHLVEALVGQNEVHVLDDFSTGDRSQLPDDVTVVEGDVRDPSAVARAAEGVDLVYHLAACIDVEESVRTPRRYDDVNVDGTLTVLEVARDQGARVVFASSAAVYGDPERVPITEGDRLAPRNPYGVSKLAAEEYCRVFHELHDLETVVLRFFNVYGPRGSGTAYSGVIDTFVEQARAGGPITVHGDGRQTRDFVHVDDVVRANLLAGSTDRVGTVYNVGTGESVRIQELAEVVASAAGADVEITHTDARERDVARSEADVSRVRRVLGYEPRVQLRDGLSSAYDL